MRAPDGVVTVTFLNLASDCFTFGLGASIAPTTPGAPQWVAAHPTPTGGDPRTPVCFAAAMDALEAIALRRSTGRLTEPAPTAAQLSTLLDAAACAPDHGTLRPWRFIVLEAEAKDDFGAVLADAYLERCRADGTEPVPAKLDKERTKLGRAPMVVVVAIEPVAGSIPTIEQVSAAAAATQNILLAATALGLGSMWRTGDPCYDPKVRAALGLSETALMLGFVYLGTAPADALEQPRPARHADGNARVLSRGAQPR